MLTTLLFALEIKFVLKLKLMLGEFNGFFIIKQIEKWSSETYVSCFSLHLFRALAASCVLYNRVEHSQGFSICQFTSSHSF